MDSEQALAWLRSATNWLRELARTPRLRDFYLGTLNEVRTAADAIEPHLTGESRESFQTARDAYLGINPLELSNEEGIMFGTDYEPEVNPTEDTLFRCLNRMVELAAPAVLQPAPGAAPLIDVLKQHLAQLEALQPSDPRTAQFYKDSFAGVQEAVHGLQSHLTDTSWNELQECWRGYSRFAPEKFTDNFPGVGKPVYAENMLQRMTKDMIRAANGELVYA